MSADVQSRDRRSDAGGLAALKPRSTKRQLRPRLTPAWFLLLGFAVALAPTLLSIAHQYWTTEAGAHGPIVVAAGGWLLARGLREARARNLVQAGKIWLSAPLLGFGLLCHIFGRVFGLMTFEAGGLYVAGVAVLYELVGSKALRHVWFPAAYLVFIIPPPGSLLDRVTGPLKQLVSASAIQMLSAAGLPVSREGVTIDVAQYRLLVEDACSGLNSLVGLLAVSLLYVYLMRGSRAAYAAVLAAFAIPISIVGNIIRIMILVLLTYFWGDEAAQGFLHETAGIALFAIDLILMFAVDHLLWRIAPKSWRGA
jgi:exosortase